MLLPNWLQCLMSAITSRFRLVGGASIIPHLTARAIVANDLHERAINFYRVISGVYGEISRDALISRCQSTLSHPTEAELAGELLNGGGFAASPVSKAWAFWAQCWIGRKGKGGTKSQGGMPSVRRKACGGTNASRVRAAASDLETWAEHFERCEWEQVCFRELLPKVADDVTCGLFCESAVGWRGVITTCTRSASETTLTLPMNSSDLTRRRL